MVVQSDTMVIFLLTKPRSFHSGKDTNLKRYKESLVKEIILQWQVYQCPQESSTDQGLIQLKQHCRTQEGNVNKRLYWIGPENR